MTIKWERIAAEGFYAEGRQPRIRRAKVPGGWLICLFDHTGDEYSNGAWGYGGPLFYPDPQHRLGWELGFRRPKRMRTFRLRFSTADSASISP